MMMNKKRLNKKKLGLYIHIPFCVKKCNYCDFLSFSSSEAEQERYISALVEEIRRYDTCHYEVDTVFIGGGTPSVLKEAFAETFFMALKENFSIQKEAEITIECNPGTVTREKLERYRELGINRLSFGLQSADNHELSLLGRIHTWEDFLLSYNMAREAGFQNINIDLMSGIPEQTVTSYEKTCEKVLALEPEHISAYSLIIEEGTPFYKRYKDYPPVDEETDRLLYMKTKEILGSAGYERYEISNYAKPGYECIHNLKYWSRDEYLGLGLGASSLIGRCRLKNPSIMAEYLKKNEGLSRYSKDTDYYEEALRLEKEDEMSEFMFLGLRMMKGVSKHKFHMLFGQKIKDVYPGVCKKLIRDGLLTECDEFYVLTERGIDISNYVMSQFLL